MLNVDIEFCRALLVSGNSNASAILSATFSASLRVI